MILKMGILLYPYFLVVFWYCDFFIVTCKKSLEVLEYTANLLSIPLLLKTFFKPLKNEYREGLVLFSVLMGMAVKSFLLLISLFILLVVLSILIAVNLVILVLPILILTTLFSRII
jgi:hypothetical protein